MIQIEEGKVKLEEEELNKIKVLCDFLFFDQYKSSASFPQFQQSFTAFSKDSKYDLFEVFKKICGEKRKYVTFGRMIKSYLKNKKNQKNKNDPSKLFFSEILSDELMKDENEEAGIQYENAIRYSTKQGNLRHFVSKICVITDENGEKIKGLRIYYDDFFKNDLFLNKRGQKFTISMELNLIGDLTEEKINGKPDMNTMDGITNVFGTYTDKITFIGFKSRSGKTSFFGKPEGKSFFYGGIGRHVKTFKCEVKNGELTCILPGYVDVVRKNPYIDKKMNEIQNEVDHADDFIYEEESLQKIDDPDELDNNIRNPIIPDDYFFDKSLEDKIKGTDINEIISEKDVNEEIGDYAESKKDIEVDNDKLMEEAALYAKYKELRESLQNQKDLLIDTGRLKEKPEDPDGEFNVGDSIKGKNLNMFINNPQNYDNLTKEIQASVEDSIQNEEPVKKKKSYTNPEMNYPEPDVIKKKGSHFNNRNDMQDYYDNINSGLLDRIITKNEDFDIEFDMDIYRNEADKKDKKSEKNAQKNWKLLSYKLSSNQGIFILQTIGAVIKSMNLLKDKEKREEIPTEEKLRIYKILKVNKPIIDMLSKAHMESVRRQNEEDELKQQLEDLKIKKKFTEEEKRNLRDYEKEKRKNAINAANAIFKEKAKELDVNDLPLISMKLEQLNEMKKKEKNKTNEKLINEYIKELTKDKTAIIRAIRQSNIDKLKTQNSKQFKSLIKESKTEREDLMEKDSLKIEKVIIEEEKNQEKNKPKAKEISFKNIKIPKGTKIYRNQELKTPIFEDKIFEPKKENLCSLRKNGSWNLPHGVHNEDLRGWEQYNWAPVNNILDSENYQVYFNEINPENIIQGDFENCSFITAVSALCKYPELIKKLFLFKEKTKEHIYGIYLRINGIWKLIFVDDFFPFYFDSEGQHRFVFSSSHKNDIWIILLEKAWAKINGNYAQSLDASPLEAFDVLTDAYTENLFISPQVKNDIYKALNDGQLNGYLLSAETSGEDKIEEYGLVPFRAYEIIEVKEVEVKYNKIKLIHLRNLWGNGDEWCGDWCNSSSLWTDELKSLCNVPDDDELNKLPTGAFWMSLDDFCKYFCMAYITHIYPDYVNSQVKIPKKDCLNGPTVHKLIVNEDDTDSFIQLHQKNPRIKLKDGDIIKKPVYGYMMLTDEEGNFIDISGKGTYNNCLRKTLDKGIYYLITDINYRFFGIKHGYSVSIYSSSKIDIDKGDVELKSLLDVGLCGYAENYLKIKKNINGGILYSSDVGNCPLKAAILDNSNGKSNLVLTCNLKRIGKNSADFYCEDGDEKEEEIIKNVPKGEIGVTIVYPYTNSSLYDFKMDISKE